MVLVFLISLDTVKMNLVLKAWSMSSLLESSRNYCGQISECILRGHVDLYIGEHFNSTFGTSSSETIVSKICFALRV